MLWLFTKLKGYLALAGVAIAAIGYVFLRGRAAGKADAQAEVREQTDKIQEKWDEIDARKPDLDAAIDSLHNRAGGQVPKASPSYRSRR